MNSELGIRDTAPATKSALHLTDDQFAECLMGSALSPTATAHLASCESCSAELSRFGLSVNDFNTAAMAWSHARTSNSLLGRASMAGRRPRLSQRPVFAAASWALATCLMVVAGVSVVQHQRHEREPTVASVAEPQEDSAAQIARDNELLTEVALATRNYDRSPVQEYSLQPDGTTSARRRGESRTQ